jgi:hypothetical protein
MKRLEQSDIRIIIDDPWGGNHVGGHGFVVTMDGHYICACGVMTWPEPNWIDWVPGDNGQWK